MRRHLPRRLALVGVAALAGLLSGSGRAQQEDLLPEDAAGFLRIRCAHAGDPPDEFTWLALPSGKTGTLAAIPTGSREVGASLPHDEPGTLHVRAGGASSTSSRACSALAGRDVT